MVHKLASVKEAVEGQPDGQTNKQTDNQLAPQTVRGGCDCPQYRPVVVVCELSSYL